MHIQLLPSQRRTRDQSFSCLLPEKRWWCAEMLLMRTESPGLIYHVFQQLLLSTDPGTWLQELRYWDGCHPLQTLQLCPLECLQGPGVGGEEGLEAREHKLVYTNHGMIWHVSPWHCYQSQEAEATQVRGPRRQSATIALLNGHNIKRTSNYRLLYMEMRASLRSHQGRLFLQGMVIDIKTHK